MGIFISPAKGHTACNLNEKRIMYNQLEKALYVYFLRNVLTSHR